MKSFAQIPVSDLIIDTDNPRTMPQTDESAAILAILQQENGPEHMEQLGESVAQFGLSALNRILIFRRNNEQIVKEGNRRMACLKFLLDLAIFPIGYDTLKSKFDGFKRLATQNNLIEELRTADCVIYTEYAEIEREINLRHALGQGGASKIDWSAMARARYNQGIGTVNNSFVLAENYIQEEYANTPERRTQLLGNFPLTTLVRFYAELCKNLPIAIPDLPAVYITHPRKPEIKRFLNAVENEQVTSRDSVNIVAQYVCAQPASPQTPPPTMQQNAQTPNTPRPQSASNTTGATPITAAPPPRTRPAPSNDTPASVKRYLRQITPRVSGTAKINTLVNEMRKINIERCPTIFSLALRTLLELSVKGYMHRKALPEFETNGNEKKINRKVIDCISHLISQGKDPSRLNGIKAQLTAGKENHLSINALHEAVHSPQFSLTADKVCLSFHNMDQLLRYLNELD